MGTATTAVAMALYAVVAQDHVALRAAPAANSAAHAQLWQGELVEVRQARRGQLQVYDHRLERAGYVRASEVRIVGTAQADAPQLLAVLRFLRDAPGAESLGIAYAAAYLKAAPAAAIDGEVFDDLGVMADRLARGATLRQGKVEALSAHMDVATQYGVRFISYPARAAAARNDAVQLCYDGNAWQELLALKPALTTPEQRARAALALTRPECMDPALSPGARKDADQQRADLLDRADPPGAGPLDELLRNRLHLRRAGVLAAVAFDKSRFGEAAQAPAQRAVDELASVSRAQLADEDAADYTEAAIRVGAVRWAAAAAPAAPGRLQVQLKANEPGQTCVSLIDSFAKTPAPLASKCTYGTVWPASARPMVEGRALALNVEPLEGWSELWVWHQDTDGWKIDVVAPDADGPGLGYVEWAGWSPAARGKMLVVREAKCQGRATRRFEVLRTDTLATEKSAGDARELTAFGLWADAGWRQETVSLR